MPSGNYCAAFGCTNNSVKCKSLKKFHGFPLRNAELCKKWVVATKRAQFVPTPSSKLCSDHFSDQSYVGAPRQSSLFPNAVPSIFNFPADLTDSDFQVRPGTERKLLKQGVVPSVFKAHPQHLKESARNGKGQAPSASTNSNRRSKDVPSTSGVGIQASNKAGEVLHSAPEAVANLSQTDQHDASHLYPRRNDRKKPSRFDDSADGSAAKKSRSLLRNQKNVKQSVREKPTDRPQTRGRRPRKMLLSEMESNGTEAAVESPEDGGADGPNKLDILISVLQNQTQNSPASKQVAGSSASSSVVRMYRSVGVMTDVPPAALERQSDESAVPASSESSSKPPMHGVILTSVDFLISELKRKGLLGVDSADLIQSNFDKNILVTIDKEFSDPLAKASHRIISDSVRKFLLTLYFHSPKAYEFFLKVSAVPRFNTVRAQLVNVQFHPGFFVQLIEKISVKDVCLLIDRVSLKRHSLCEDEEIVGFCDYGGVIAEDPNEMASEAVVFLLVSIEAVPKRFPIGYFLVHQLSAQIQSQLVESAIILAAKNSLTVHSVVCDGDISNFSSFHLLGCQFDDTNSVSHLNLYGLKQNVYAMFDVNHLMTLAHNALADLGVFVTAEGEKISWEYLAHLYTMESELHSNATPLDPQLMSALVKVNMASHVFSASVADALIELRYACVPGFEDSLPTAQFIQKLDQAYSILNCKSDFGKGLHSPIDSANSTELRTTITDFMTYLLGLKTEAGVLLHKSARKTFIQGFLSTCQSVLELSDHLLQKRSQVYTNCFTLEHSERFFEKIYSHSSFPSAAKFKASMKKVLGQQMESSAHAGALDCSSSVGIVKPKWSKRCATIHTNEREETLCETLAYLVAGQTLSDEVLFTVASTIVTALRGSIACDACCLALTNAGSVINRQHYTWDLNNVFQALMAVKKGEGQIIPSQEVFKIVQRCEQIFRHTVLARPSRYAGHRNLPLFLSVCYRLSVLEDRPLTTFTHVCALQKGMLPHRCQLSNCIVSEYFNIRLKHFTRLHCLQALLRPH